MEKDLVKNNEIEKPDIVEITLPESNTPPAEPKPKRKYKPREKKAPATPAKKVDPAKLGVNEVNSLLTGIFGLAAMKAGDHWSITEQEANSISQPLVNILDKMNITEKVANVSDGAMLVVAVATITIPRALISNEMMKQKKVTKEEKIISELREVKQVEAKRDNTETGKPNFNRAAEVTADDLQLTAPVYFSDAQ